MLWLGLFVIEQEQEVSLEESLVFSAGVREIILHPDGGRTLVIQSFHGRKDCFVELVIDALLAWCMADGRWIDCTTAPYFIIRSSSFEGCSVSDSYSIRNTS